MQKGEPFPIPYTLFDMAEDIIHLLDTLSIDKAHVIGRSMGGMIAQIVAAKFPERTLSLRDHVINREPSTATKRSRCYANADEPKC